MKKIKVFYGFMGGMVLILLFLQYLRNAGVLNFDPLYIGQVLMILPATGVAFTKLGEEEELYRKVNRMYLGLFACAVVVFALHICKILDGKQAVNLISIPFGLGSIYLVRLYMNSGREITKKFALISKDFLYLVGVILIKNAVGVFGYSDDYGQFVSSIMMLVVVPIMALLASVQYWGEEYAWRYFLQEHLQNKWGKRGGIIVLGIIWETYHAPLWFTTYDLQVTEVLLRYVLGIALSFFLGYLYMKTQNIWAPIFGHCIFNTLQQGNGEVQMGMTESVIITLIFAALFALYAFKKEYKTKDSRLNEEI